MEIYTYSKKKTKFLLKHGNVPCGTCDTGGRPVFGPRNLDEMIENFVEVGYNFRNHQTLWNKLKQGTESANAAMREGTQHTLEIFRKNANPLYEVFKKLKAS